MAMSRRVGRDLAGRWTMEGSEPRFVTHASTGFTDVPVHVGEAALDAVVVEAEALVIEAEQVEHGGVEVVDGGHVLHGLVAEVIRRAVAEWPRFTPAPVSQTVKPLGL